MFKALAALAAVTVCCLSNDYPAKSEMLYRTGDSVYGGSSYNFGRYETDILRSTPATEVIRDRDGNSYRCHLGYCRSY